MPNDNNSQQGGSQQRRSGADMTAAEVINGFAGVARDAVDRIFDRALANDPRNRS